MTESQNQDPDTGPKEYESLMSMWHECNMYMLMQNMLAQTFIAPPEVNLPRTMSPENPNIQKTLLLRTSSRLGNKAV